MESNCEKLLRVTFNKKGNFKMPIEDLWKGGSKPHAFAHLSNYNDPIKLEILMNSFISSHLTIIH